MIKIAPSILSADYGNLGPAVAKLKAWGADYVHFDVMDGSFVPAISFGAGICKAIRAYTDLPLDVHLMVEHPETQIAAFAEAGADIITIHVEADRHAHRTLQQIHGLGCKAGVVLNPGTPISMAGASVTQLRNGVAHVGKPRRRRPVLHSRNLAKAAPIAAAGPKQEPKHRY